MKAPFILTLCFAALALPGCGSVGVNRSPATAGAGGTAPRSPSVSFMEADADGDARITPHEYDVHFARDGAQPESFQAADTNRDGVLTLDEWQALVSRPATALSAPRR
jgi:hypothetical protein